MGSPRLPSGSRWLAILGIASFMIGGVYLAPAALLGFRFDDAGIAYRSLEGRIWNGVANGVVAGDIYLEKVQFKLDPVALFAGALNFNLIAQGSLEGNGDISVGVFSKRIQVRNARIRIDLSSIRSYSLFGARYEGHLKVDVARLLWSKNGCEVAEGEVWTDVLSGTLQRHGGEGVVLSGIANCEGADLRVALAGENAQGAAQVSLLVRPDMNYRITANVAPTDQTTRVNLRLFGFEERDQILTFDAAGEIKGVRS